LKIAVVLVHEGVRWEIWLAGKDRRTRDRYSKLFSDKGWTKHRISPTEPGVDAIIESVLVEDADYDHLDSLTATIEERALEFIEDIRGFLLENG
jgi:hypothetical protein